MITVFESFNEPDLREMSEFVRCKKTYKKAFIKGNIYKVVFLYGDPQRAIEEFQMNNYTPIECLSAVLISIGDSEKYQDHRKFSFRNKHYSANFGNLPNFWEYFEIMEESTSSKKYNL